MGRSQCSEILGCDAQHRFSLFDNPRIVTLPKSKKLSAHRLPRDLDATQHVALSSAPLASIDRWRSTAGPDIRLDQPYRNLMVDELTEADRSMPTCLWGALGKIGRCTQEHDHIRYTVGSGIGAPRGYGRSRRRYATKAYF